MRVLGQGCGACSASCSTAQHVLLEHSPLEEREWISLCRALASPSFLLHSAGNPVLARKPTQRLFRLFPSSLRGSRACRLRLDTVLPPAVSTCSPHTISRHQRKAFLLVPSDLGATKSWSALAACGMQLATSHSHCCPRTQPTSATPSTSSSARRPRPLCPLQVGRELLSSRPHAQEDVQANFQGLSSKWEELRRKVAERGKQLQRDSAARPAPAAATGGPKRGEGQGEGPKNEQEG